MRHGRNALRLIFSFEHVLEVFDRVVYDRVSSLENIELLARVLEQRGSSSTAGDQQTLMSYIASSNRMEKVILSLVEAILLGVMLCYRTYSCKTKTTEWVELN